MKAEGGGRKMVRSRDHADQRDPQAGTPLVPDGARLSS
jgi:hypothetical protein